MIFPTPLFDNIILEPDEEVAEKSTLFVPDNLKEKPRSGIIVSCGKGKQCEESGVWIEMQVKEGDRVKYGRFTGAPVNIDGKEYVIMKQTDCLVIL